MTSVAQGSNSTDAVEPSSARHEPDLPPGWVWATLEQVAELNPATRFDGLPEDSLIPFIPMAAVAEESGGVDATQRRPVRAVRKGYVRFKRGDVLFAKITPCMENGKTAPVFDLEGEYAAGSTEFHVLRPRAVDARYLWYWLVRRAFRDEARRNMSGSAGQLRVPLSYLRSAKIPVAPIAEQKRIVARIDELFAEIAEGEAALARARQGLDTWRRSLLKAAVTGELTNDWRAANKPTETGADLIRRLKDDRTTARRAGKAEVSLSSEWRTLPSLPAGWVWVPFEELIDTLRNGTSVVPTRGTTEVPILRISAVRSLSVDHTDVRYVTREEASALAEFRVRKGDLLFTRYNGSRALVAVCGRFDRDTEVLYPDKLIRIRLKEGCQHLTGFVQLAANVGYTRSYLNSQVKTTAGQHGISGASIRKAPIPLPPPEEAIAIGALVASLLRERDEVAVNLIGAEHQGAMLRQAILKAAFEGRLVKHGEPAALKITSTITPCHGPSRTAVSGVHAKLV